jgi:hypothetical protein
VHVSVASEEILARGEGGGEGLEREENGNVEIKRAERMRNL